MLNGAMVLEWTDTFLAAYTFAEWECEVVKSYFTYEWYIFPVWMLHEAKCEF